jgi:hypothetical protein
MLLRRGGLSWPHLKRDFKEENLPELCAYLAQVTCEAIMVNDQKRRRGAMTSVLQYMENLKNFASQLPSSSENARNYVSVCEGVDAFLKVHLNDCALYKNLLSKKESVPDVNNAKQIQRIVQFMKAFNALETANGLSLTDQNEVKEFIFGKKPKAKRKKNVSSESDDGEKIVDSEDETPLVKRRGPAKRQRTRESSAELSSSDNGNAESSVSVPLVQNTQEAKRGSLGQPRIVKSASVPSTIGTENAERSSSVQSSKSSQDASRTRSRYPSSLQLGGINTPEIESDNQNEGTSSAFRSDSVEEEMDWMTSKDRSGDPSLIEPEVVLEEGEEEVGENEESEIVSSNSLRDRHQSLPNSAQKTPTRAELRDTRGTSTTCSVRLNRVETPIISSSQMKPKKLKNSAKKSERVAKEMQEQEQQKRGKLRGFRIPSGSKSPSSLPLIDVHNADRGYPVTTLAGNRVITTLNNFILSDQLERQGTAISFPEEEVHVNEEKTEEIPDLEEIMQSMTKLAKYWCPPSIRPPVGMQGVTIEDSIIIGEGADQIWRIGTGNFHQRRLEFSPRLFVHDKGSFEVKQTSLLSKLARNIKPDQFYQEMYDKTVMISAPVIVLNAFKLSSDLWSGMNVIFSRNDGVDITLHPATAIASYVQNLLNDKRGANQKIDCLIIVLGETELFDHQSVHLASNDQMKPDAQYLASFLQFSLQQIAVAMNCPIFFGGYLDLKSPVDDVQATTILERRERRNNCTYPYKKKHFDAYSKVVLSIQNELFNKRFAEMNCGNCNSNHPFRRANPCSKCSPNCQVFHVNTTLINHKHESEIPEANRSEMFTLQGRPSNVYLRYVISAIKICVTAVCLGHFRDNIPFSFPMKIPTPEFQELYNKYLEQRDKLVQPKFKTFVWSVARQMQDIELQESSSSKKPAAGGSKNQTQGK